MSARLMKRINLLHEEAGMAGDPKMQELCRLAIAGDKSAQQECWDVISKAELDATTGGWGYLARSRGPRTLKVERLPRPKGNYFLACEEE